MKKPPKKLKNKQPSPDASPAKQEKRGYIWLYVLPDELWLKAHRSETILEALQRTDIELEGDCGGLGKCGKCKARVLSPIDFPSSEEKEHLDEREIKQSIRLACRNKIERDLVIQIDKTDSEEPHYQILATGHIPVAHIDPLIDKQLITLDPDSQNDGLSDFERIKSELGPQYQDLEASLNCLRTLPEMLEKTQFQGAAVLHGNHLLAWQSRQEVGRRYGLVFDVGTSTLVGKLINLLDGNEVSAVSRLNSQTRYGTDIISRIQYVNEHSEGLNRLTDLVITDLNSITKDLLEGNGLHSEDIFVAVVAGNTTMQHLLLGLSPLGIGRAPFTPVATEGLIIKSADIGLRLHPEALLYLMPAKSAYIGGDLTSFIISSGAAEEKDKMILGLDLGTNGEIFLGNRDRLITCSAAAGPALEGAKISHGMIAKAGAIESAYFQDGNLSYQIIGNIKPKGICGSGLVDLVSLLLHHGVIDYEGLIQHRRTEKSLGSRVVERAGVYDFLIASAEESFDQRPIYLTQKDVRQLQLAKGAVAAGIKILLEEMGVRIKDIDEIKLAGAFGNYINPSSGMRIGLIPVVEPEIIKSLGNASSNGASMVLLSKDYWKMANDLVNTIEHIELSSRSDFNQYFIESLNFPKKNIW